MKWPLIAASCVTQKTFVAIKGHFCSLLLSNIIGYLAFLQIRHFLSIRFFLPYFRSAFAFLYLGLYFMDGFFDRWICLLTPVSAIKTIVSALLFRVCSSFYKLLFQYFRILIFVIWMGNCFCDRFCCFLNCWGHLFFWFSFAPSLRIFFLENLSVFAMDLLWNFFSFSSMLMHIRLWSYCFFLSLKRLTSFWVVPLCDYKISQKNAFRKM